MWAPMSALRFEGTYTALVTPFRDEPGAPLDGEALDRLIDSQIDSGVTGLVPCGTTGRKPDALPPRAFRGDRKNRHQGRRETSSHRRGRVEFDARGGESRATRRARRGRRDHDRRTLLQPAHAGRTAASLRGSGKGGATPDRRLQHPVAYRRRPLPETLARISSYRAERGCSQRSDRQRPSGSTNCSDDGRSHRRLERGRCAHVTHDRRRSARGHQRHGESSSTSGRRGHAFGIARSRR